MLHVIIINLLIRVDNSCLQVQKSIVNRPIRRENCYCRIALKSQDVTIATAPILDFVVFLATQHLSRSLSLGLPQR